jgi:hypothetical protein
MCPLTKDRIVEVQSAQKSSAESRYAAFQKVHDDLGRIAPEFPRDQRQTSESSWRQRISSLKVFQFFGISQSSVGLQDLTEASRSSVTSDRTIDALKVNGLYSEQATELVSSFENLSRISEMHGYWNTALCYVNDAIKLSAGLSMARQIQLKGRRLLFLEKILSAETFLKEVDQFYVYMPPGMVDSIIEYEASISLARLALSRDPNRPFCSIFLLIRAALAHQRDTSGSTFEHSDIARDCEMMSLFLISKPPQADQVQPLIWTMYRQIFKTPSTNSWPQFIKSLTEVKDSTTPFIQRNCRADLRVTRAPQQRTE